MIKFMIVVPRNISPKGTIPRIHIPLGALAIASQARKEGFDVKLFDTSLGSIDENTKDTYFERCTRVVSFDGEDYWETGLSDDEIVKKIDEYSPDIIAVSCCTVVDREDTKYLCALIKKYFRDIPIYLGGHEISHNYKKVFDNKVERNYIPDIEGVSLGLGQPNVSDIINYILATNKKAVKYPRGFASIVEGEIYASEISPMNPNDYSLFDYSLLEKVYVKGREKPYDVYSFIGNTHAGNISKLLKFNQVVSYFPLFTSYGCGFNCTFCDTDQYLLRYSFDNVVKMINSFEELYGIDYIDIMDNNFAGGGSESRKICFQILNYLAKHHYKIGFSNGLTFESMMRNEFELFQVFENYGNVVHIAFLCENGNERVLNMIRKPHNIDMIKKTLMYAREHLKHTNREAFFIGGFPDTLGQVAETPDEVNNTVCFIEYLIKNNLLDQAIFLKLSPVTSMYREMWEDKHPDKSFVHCLFSRGTDIWPYNNDILEGARVEVIKINEDSQRFVTRKL